MNIYQILSSKPHNPHHLKRYHKFILACQEKNESDFGYKEQHHICPKAKDLFPEYANFNENPWNKVELTARQHIVAHIMLWKCFGGSQSSALHCMIFNFNSETNSLLSNRVVSINSKHHAKLREDRVIDLSEKRKGKVVLRDSEGDTYYLDKDDPKIEELGLYGCASGNEFSEETREHMRKMKDPYRKIKLYFLDNSINVLCNQEEYEDYLSQGWLPYYHPNDREFTKTNKYEAVSEKLKGRADYMTLDGTYYGKLEIDDPVIEELGLVYHKTEARIESARNANKINAEKRKDGTWYNNGKTNVIRHEHPGEGWVEGLLSSVEGKNKRAEGLRKVRADTVCYNDGKKNYYIKTGDPVPEGLKLGMAPQKKREMLYYKPGTDLKIKCVPSKKPDGYYAFNDKNIRIHGL